MGRDREASRSRRNSPSLSPVRNDRRSRRDRSPPSYSYSRKRSNSLSSRYHRSGSPLSPKRKKVKKSTSPSTAGTKETEHAVNEKLRKDEEARKKRQQEAELKLIEEETAKRVGEVIRKKVEEALNRDDIRFEVERRLKEGRKRGMDEVCAQLEKEKEDAALEARRKEEEGRREKEEMEEKRRRMEEALIKEAVERERREEERYRELVELQKKKEEDMQRKKEKEEEEKAKQMKLLGKDKSRPKLSFALGFVKNKNSHFF